MILRLLVACFFVASAVFFAEVAKANKWVSGERARKLIHIMVGIWAAWLPIWLGWKSIIVLGVMLLIGVFLVNHLKWVSSIRSVNRSTVGEYLFPISMIILAVFFKDTIIFAAAMLQLGISDGFAAVIGTRYGKKTVFRVFGHKKSKHGTATFFVCSTIIFFWAIWALNPGLVDASIIAWFVSLLIASVISAVITSAELISQKGLDNITVPLLTAFALTMIS